MSPEAVSGHHSFLLFLIIFIISPAISQSDQREVLLKFKQNLAASNTQVFTSWNQINPLCNFTGIICNGQGFVTEINLSEQQLVGALDFDSICSIHSLERISVGLNHLHGNVSSHLSNCTNLQFLDLGGNLFSGEFPEMSTLTKLQLLDINLNGFSGQFPWKSLQTLTNLTFLSLGDNLLEKTQFPSEILNLYKLRTIYLANCSIEGRIPEGIENLRSLRRLELSRNFLIGEIPENITKLINLEILELYTNQLSGTFPNGFRNLVMLYELDVSENTLEGNLTELRNMTRLESLQLFKNKFSGGIPVEFGEFKFLREFSIYRNMFTGELPAKIGSWADFAFIDASTNFLSGPIPPDMCKHGKMDALLMIQNKFTGGLPESYGNCSSLLRLRLTDNSLSGRIPDGIWSLPNVGLIDLAMNQFEGQVSSSIVKAKSLTELVIFNNTFSGELPEEISEVSSLIKIELMYNFFSGEIPARIGDLKNLTNLHLEGNFFSGNIPESLGSCVALNDINLAGNSFSGHIPASLGSLRPLNSLNLSNNKLSGAIPTSLSSLPLSLIDLSNNMLTGRVPESFSAESYKGSFAGNPELCSDRIKGLEKCTRGLGVAKYSLIGAAILVVLVLGFLIVRFVYKGKSRQTDATNQSPSLEMMQYYVGNFNKDEILNSINEDNLIGHGGSGNVHKVELRCGMTVAVKQLFKSRTGIRRPEFDVEVAILTSIRHANVIKLYCSITGEDSDLLVYEYMPNGSLWDRLHTDQTIDMAWNIRYGIAVGVAKALAYMHDGYSSPVIHRDVKSGNILLDEEMKPKIADFGVAKIMQTNQDTDSSRVIAGTYGYIAPEYCHTFNMTEKSDVYSFGVVLLELVTGKTPLEAEFGEGRDIVCWVEDAMRSNDNLIGLVDSRIADESKQNAVGVMTIAMRCTNKMLPTRRPGMNEVVRMLTDFAPIVPVDTGQVSGENQATSTHDENEIVPA